MDAGARGCYIILAGKLSGQRHRTEKFKEGSIKYCGDPKIQFVKHGFAVATLNSAAANADYKGLDSASMVITTITTSRGQVIPGHMPRAQGRATEWNQDTVNIEIIISEVE